MSPCPCCSHQLIRQISRQRLYWFCSSCRQEMPNFSQLTLAGKTLTSVSSESEKRSLQKAHFNKSLDISYQLDKTLKSAFASCPVKLPLVTNT